MEDRASTEGWDGAQTEAFRLPGKGERKISDALSAHATFFERFLENRIVFPARTFILHRWFPRRCV